MNQDIERCRARSEENCEPSDSAKHSKSDTLTDTSRSEQCARVLKWGRSINRKWFGEEYSSVRFVSLDGDDMVREYAGNQELNG